MKLLRLPKCWKRKTHQKKRRKRNLNKNKRPHEEAGTGSVLMCESLLLRATCTLGQSGSPGLRRNMSADTTTCQPRASWMSVPFTPFSTLKGYWVFPLKLLKLLPCCEGNFNGPA